MPPVIKNSLLLCLAVLFCVSSAVCTADDAVVHLVLAIDSSANDRVGSTVSADGFNVGKLFKDNVPANRLNIIELTKGSLSKDKIIGSIQEIRADKNDCIVFFYSGHGAYSSEISTDSDDGHYFQLQNRTRISRRSVLDGLKMKQVRLIVLITDCCNVTRNIKPPESPLLMSAVSLSPLFAKLFFEAEGIADITAAKKDQCSFIYPSAEKDKGSIFTWIFCRTLNDERRTQKDWNEIFNAVSEISNKDFVRSYPKGAYVKTLNMTQRTMNPYTWSLPQTKTNGNSSGVAERRDRSRLGVRAENTPLGAGVRITEIIADSPGQAANLRVGDTITEINGQKIRSEQDYVNAVKSSPRKMTFAIETLNGTSYEGTVTLEY